MRKLFYENWRISKCNKDKYYLCYDFNGTRSMWHTIAEFRSYKRAKEAMLNIDTIIMKVTGRSTL